MELREKLVLLRKRNGLSQLELAAKLNVSRQAISKWEVGTATPSTESLRAISVLYDIPIDYLLTNCCSEEAIVTLHKKDVAELIQDGEPKAETPPPPEQVKKTNWKYITIFMAILLLFLITIFFVVYQKVNVNDSSLFVDEMQTDNWSISNSENFSVKW